MHGNVKNARDGVHTVGGKIGPEVEHEKQSKECNRPRAKKRGGARQQVDDSGTGSEAVCGSKEISDTRKLQGGNCEINNSENNSKNA